MTLERITVLPRLPPRQADSNKGSYGRILIVAGSRGMSGAAVLSGNTFRSTEFTPAEKAVLLFTECYALDAQSIADEVAEEAKAHLGEAGLVFLIEALGCLDARIRAARCLRGLSLEGGRRGH